MATYLGPDNKLYGKMEFEELDRWLSEDPEDRRIREAHGFTYEDDFNDLTLLCRNGCGLSYFDAAVDKIEICRRKSGDANV